MRLLTTALDLAGLAFVAVAAYLVAVRLGLVVTGAGCLFASWRLSR